jgi:hypothetical protein
MKAYLTTNGRLDHIQKTFEKIVLSMSVMEFEDCVFKNCDLSNSDFKQYLL